MEDEVTRLEGELADAAHACYLARLDTERERAEVTQLRAERDDLDRRGIALHAAYAREVRRVGESEERAEAAERLAHDRGEALREISTCANAEKENSERKGRYLGTDHVVAWIARKADEALAGVVPPEQAL